MLNFSEFPEFISCAVQICTDAFECGLQEASASKLKELI